MSKNRQETLKALANSEKPMKPTEISEELNIAFNSSSRALRQLSEKKIVECINPDAPRYRRYRITNVGNKIVFNL
jgi:Mn-dependent DtxR family transcriptional regulator